MCTHAHAKFLKDAHAHAKMLRCARARENLDFFGTMVRSFFEAICMKLHFRGVIISSAISRESEKRSKPVENLSLNKALRMTQITTWVECVLSLIQHGICQVQDVIF